MNLKATLIPVALIIVSIALGFLKLKTNFSAQGDAGQLYFILQNIHNGLGAYNPIMPSLMDYIWGKQLVTMDPNLACQTNLDSPLRQVNEFNHLNFHKYYILFPLSLLMFFLDGPLLFQSAVIGAYIFFLYFVYKICSKKIKGWCIPIFVTTCILLHPAWSWSILWQPYVDELFLPFGLLLVYYSTKPNLKDDIYKYLFILLACSLIVEKTVLYTGIYLILCFFLYPKLSRNKKIFNLTIGIGFLLFFVFTIKFNINNTYYQKSIDFNLIGIYQQFENKIFFNGTVSFILINGLLLIPALFFSFRSFLIAVILMLPNIIGNIGGAEKTTFATHYHILYLPFLAAAFISGVSGFCNRFEKSYKNYGLFLYFTVVIFLYSFVVINENRQIAFDSKQIYLNPVRIFYYMRDLDAYDKARRVVKQTIKSDASISSIESAWPFLNDYLNVRMYPFDIDKVNHVILGYQKRENGYFYTGFGSFINAEAQDQVNLCLNERLKKNGFNMSNPALMSGSIAILSK